MRLIKSTYHIPVIALIIALLACASTEARRRSPERPNAERKPKVNAASLEKKVHTLINKQRQKHGLAPLAWDDDLARIAQKHSQDMAKRSYFSHVSPEGKDFADRYKKEGYSCGVKVGQTIYTGAENIFQNNLYDSVTTVNGKEYYDWNSEDRIAETTVAGWMKSPGHRKNILTPHWGKEGIGITISPDGKEYVTQNFC
jgi:uncharacterized protein YkwD